MEGLIKCKVEECCYNSNCECTAQEIEIRSSAAGEHVSNAAGTCCQTFCLG